MGARRLYHTVQREGRDNIAGGHGMLIVKQHILAQIDQPDASVGAALPGCCQLSAQGAVSGDFSQRIKDQPLPRDLHEQAIALPPGIAARRPRQRHTQPPARFGHGRRRHPCRRQQGRRSTRGK